MVGLAGLPHAIGEREHARVGAVGERGARLVGHLSRDHRDVRDPQLGRPRQHPADNLAFEARSVEPPLAGHHERRAVERRFEPDRVGDRLESRHELGADRREPTCEPARGPGRGHRGHVEPGAFPVLVGEQLEPARQQRDLRRRRALLGAVDPRRVEERRLDVARDRHFHALQ